MLFFYYEEQQKVYSNNVISDSFKANAGIQLVSDIFMDLYMLWMIRHMFNKRHHSFSVITKIWTKQQIKKKKSLYIFYTSIFFLFLKLFGWWWWEIVIIKSEYLFRYTKYNKKMKRCFTCINTNFQTEVGISDSFKY